MMTEQVQIEVPRRTWVTKNGMCRTKFPPQLALQQAIVEPGLVSLFAEQAKRCRTSLYHFLQYFWDEVSTDEFKPNWHIEYLCGELMKIAHRVSRMEPREHDLIINVPPGTTKTVTASIMFPVWCWINWHWMRFITASYSSPLALESAEHSRDLVRSERFQNIFPELSIKQDKDQKSNFVIMRRNEHGKLIRGGSRFSTSVGGTLMGFHAHIFIIDDALDPRRAASETELRTANNWMDYTVPTRKVDKAVTPMVNIQQRLAEDDSSGHLLAKKKKNVRVICFPGEIRSYRDAGSPTGFKQELPLHLPVSPAEFIEKYEDDLLDPVRMPWPVLKDMEADLGQYGYAGQVLQNPTPPSGGMFKTDRFITQDALPANVKSTMIVRYWDKAATDPEKEGKFGAYTVGVKMALIEQIGLAKKWYIIDVKRFQKAAEEREQIIRATAEADGRDVIVWHEQEPGSGGKDSAKSTISNLAGYSSYADPPDTNKIARADQFSVQVNNSNVILLRGDWNREFKAELALFPFSKNKDQVDSASGAFRKLTTKKVARVIGGRRSR